MVTPRSRPSAAENGVVMALHCTSVRLYNSKDLEVLQAQEASLTPANPPNGKSAKLKLARFWVCGRGVVQLARPYDI